MSNDSVGLYFSSFIHTHTHTNITAQQEIWILLNHDQSNVEQNRNFPIIQLLLIHSQLRFNPKYERGRKHSRQA